MKVFGESRFPIGTGPFPVANLRRPCSLPPPSFSLPCCSLLPAISAVNHLFSAHNSFNINLLHKKITPKESLFCSKKQRTYTGTPLPNKGLTQKYLLKKGAEKADFGHFSTTFCSKGRFFYFFALSLPPNPDDHCELPF